MRGRRMQQWEDALSRGREFFQRHGYQKDEQQVLPACVQQVTGNGGCRRRNGYRQRKFGAGQSKIVGAIPMRRRSRESHDASCGFRRAHAARAQSGVV